MFTNTLTYLIELNKLSKQLTFYTKNIELNSQDLFYSVYWFTLEFYFCFEKICQNTRWSSLKNKKKDENVNKFFVKTSTC